MLGNVGALVYGSLGVMIKPLGDEFGWSRGDISLALTYVTVAVALGIPVSGILIDRFGSKLIVSISISIAGLALLLGPFFISSLGLFYFFIALVSLVGTPTNTVGYVRVISEWFDRRRGLFIGINASGLGVGFALVPLLTAWAVGIGGWRWGYATLGIILLVIILPSLTLLLVNNPRDLGLLPDGALRDDARANTGSDAGLSIRDVIRTKVFWLMIVIIPSISFALNGILTQLVPMLTDRGFGIGTAVAVASTMGLSMAVARIAVGVAVDRFFAPHVAVFVFVFVLLGIAMLLYGQNVESSFVAAILMGFGIGAEADLMAFLVTRYFGLRHFATVFGLVFTSYLLGTGFGPYFMGRAFDAAGNYDNALVLCIALIALATVLFTLLGPYDQYLRQTEKAGLQSYAPKE